LLPGEGARIPPTTTRGRQSGSSPTAAALLAGISRLDRGTKAIKAKFKQKHEAFTKGPGGTATKLLLALIGS
jgi:hypothetical protein